MQQEQKLVPLNGQENRTSNLPPPLVTVVIPAHNYAHYVPFAIRSVQAQKLNNFECFIINDRSTDNSEEVIQAAIKGDARFHLLNADFGNLSATRNFGIRQGNAPYVAVLDADDMMGSENFLEILVTALEQEHDLDIAFTGITVMDAEGKLGHLNAWPKGYDVERMVQRQNQIPSLCVFRRRIWERAGGFRPHFKYAEDAEFWLTCIGLGARASQITEEGLFHYRLHANSASRVHRTGEIPEPDWTEFHPWTKDGLRPFAAEGKAPQGSWPVRFYNRPDISIIIPVGPGHEETLKDALHSVEGQTHRFWECIVVNDTGTPLCLEGFPWAKVIETDGRIGAGAARNLGAKHANARLLAFLDADDLFKPRFLEATFRAFRQNGRYAYTDWLTDDGRGKVEVHKTPAYSFGAIWEKPSIHAISVLIPRQWFEAVGGFDESLSAYEDVEFFMKLLVNGYCGVRVAEPLLIYNLDSGQRRAAGKAFEPAFKKLLEKRYGAYMRGEQKVCDCVQPPKGKNPEPPTPENAAEYRETYGSPVKVEYVSQFAPASPVTLRGPATNVFYGARAKHDIFYIWEADYTNSEGMFEKVEDYVPPVEATVMPPAPELLTAEFQGIPVREGWRPEMAQAAEEAFDEVGYVVPGTGTTVEYEPLPEIPGDLAFKTEDYSGQFADVFDDESGWVDPPMPGGSAADPEPDLESMTKAELRQYAADHGIDLTGARTNAEITQRIWDAKAS